MNFPLKTSVRLKEAEAASVEKITSQGSDQAAALTQLTGVLLGTEPSAATALHAVVVAGLKAIDARAEEIGYQRLAAFLATDDETRRWLQSRRARAVQYDIAPVRETA